MRRAGDQPPVVYPPAEAPIPSLSDYFAAPTGPAETRTNAAATSLASLAGLSSLSSGGAGVDLQRLLAQQQLQQHQEREQQQQNDITTLLLLQLQQQQQAPRGPLAPETNIAAFALLKQQEEQFMASHALSRQRQLDELLGSQGLNGSVFAQNQRQMPLGGSVGASGASQSLGGSTNVAALLKHQEDQLMATHARATQQGQLSELLSSPGMGGSLRAQQQHLPLPSRSAHQLVNAAHSPAWSALLGGNESSTHLSPRMNVMNKSTGEESKETHSPTKKLSQEGKDPESSESDEEEEEEQKDGQEQDPNNDTFPHKLYRMLAEAEEDDKEHILSFFPHGRAFSINKPHDFVREIMPKYFTTSRMSSFQRQLNLYGFRRITEGPEKGGYFHSNFRKGKKRKVRKIKRKKTTTKAPTHLFTSSLPSSQSLLAERGLALMGNRGTGDVNQALLLLMQQQQQQQQNDLVQEFLLRQQQQQNRQL